MLIASLSWRYVEEPIRHGALGGYGSTRSGRRRVGARVRGRSPCSRWALGAILALAIVGVSGGLPVASAGTATAAGGGSLLRTMPATGGSTTTATAHPDDHERHDHNVHDQDRRHDPSGHATHAGGLPTRSSCRSVVYIGDSTSEGEISTDYIPNPRQRLQAQLADVGVAQIYPEISGARSIFETFEGHPNAATVAQQHVVPGFHGCWILALGTNDVANVHDGSTVGYAERINRMMSIIGHQPVLWVSVVTLLQLDRYSEDGMQRWNHVCSPRAPAIRTCACSTGRYWAKRQWFIPDGIHYYSPGYIARAHRISQGLAHAFPDGRSPSSSCLVR